MIMKTFPKTCESCRYYSPFKPNTPTGNCVNEANNIDFPPGTYLLVDHRCDACPNYKKSEAQINKELGY